MVPKRQLHQQSIHAKVRIEVFHGGDDLVDGGVGGEGDVPECDTDFVCGFVLHADVGGGIGAGAGLEDGEGGIEMGVFGLEVCDALADVVSDGPVGGEDGS